MHAAVDMEGVGGACGDPAQQGMGAQGQCAQGHRWVGPSPASLLFPQPLQPKELPGSGFLRCPSQGQARPRPRHHSMHIHIPVPPAPHLFPWPPCLPVCSSLPTTGVTVLPQPTALARASDSAQRKEEPPPGDAQPGGTSSTQPAMVLAQDFVDPQFLHYGRPCYIRLWAVVTSVNPLRCG